MSSSLQARRRSPATSRSCQGRRTTTPSESGGEGGAIGIRRAISARTMVGEVNRRLVLIGAVVAALAVGGAVGRGRARRRRRRARPRRSRSSSHRARSTCTRSPATSSLTTRSSPTATHQLCYEQAFGNVAYYKGPKAALALFAARDGGQQGDRGRLPPDRAQDRLRPRSSRFHGNIPKAFAAGQLDLLVGLLPRDPRARLLRDLHRGRADQGGAPSLRRARRCSATSGSSTSASTGSATG